MDGEVATALVDPALLGHHPVRFSDDPDDDAPGAPGWSSAEDEALVADRLRQLGYLE